MATPQHERDEALAAYRAACAEFDAAHEEWDPFLAPSDVIELDSAAAEAAFSRLQQANYARQEALDWLWVAWRNRPEVTP